MTGSNRDAVKLIEHDSTIERDYGNLPLFTVRPDVEGPLPALILVHEIFGLNNHIRDVARRFARQGLMVFAPDLFAGHSAAPDNRDDLNAMRNLWSVIRDDQLICDLQAVFAMARSEENVLSSGIGTLGYCMGGAIAFLFASRTPLLAWCIDYYGRIYYPGITEFKPRHPIDYTGGLNCPFLAFYAGVDDLIPPEQIKLFEEKLEDLGKSYTIKVYPTAKHAFFNDQREFYHYEAAEDAWLITLDFIALHSGPKPTKM